MTTTDEPLSSLERQEMLVALIRERRRISVAEVCEAFSVSPATARRDLDAVVQQGFAQRTHGGAIAPRQAPPEQPAIRRTEEQGEEKQRIGRAAALLVDPGDSVFIGSGTTALEVAKNLAAVPSLTVLTNSLLVLNALSAHQHITLVSLGGMLRRSEMSLIGHITEQALREVRASKVFMGIRAIDIEQGLTNDYLPETMSDRVIIKCAPRLIVLADHSKCGRVAAGFVAPVDAVHTLVTDARAPADFLDRLMKRGVGVVIA
jgi:DeoR/GlpR family transcriptional regulator of sugar metabolism